jgi:exopolyphosphatase/guanosine-5'-triphosphate,3'-diphosphate pyrophosphatase
MTITRLGAGVDQTGALAPEAIARTLHALETYQGVIDAHGVVAVRAAATSAARDAANADTFFDGAERVLGVRPELLSGEEEGRLSYAGATADLDGEHGPFFVCDLGGGSTELVAGGPDGEPAATLSLDVGCVRVTERFFDSDPPTPDALSRARAHIGELVDGARRSLPGLAAPRVMIGLAGTVSALVTLSLGLDQYDREKLHHAHLSRASVEESLQLLAAIPASERRRRPGIEPGRADVIVGGALVLAVVMESFGHEELIYSESDILDGLAADLRQRVGAAHSR